MPNFAAQLSRILFADKGVRAYAVIDGANTPELLAEIAEHRPEYECLYRGELAPDIAEVAPYLVRLDPAHPFTSWLLAHGWGESRGVFLTTAADMRGLRRHLRTFLIVHDPQGAPLYFRYYDPRVLRVYLPTCDADELKIVFGPVTSYVLEGEDPAVALRFGVKDGSLRREDLTLT